MSLPTVSICIPAYRAEKYLPAALETVRSQTFQDWELIVTEDGSKDSAEDIVRRFAQSVAQPVTYNRHDKNRGLPETRNTGMAAARAPWIAFLDADDLWLPEHLAKLVAAASQDVQLVYAGSQIFDDATGTDLEVRVPTPESLQNFPASLYTGKIIIQPSAAMISRSALQKNGGFSASYPICNDLEYWVRLASRGGKARYSGAVTCRYRKHPAAMSQKAAALIAETGRICEAYRDWKEVPAALRRTRAAKLYFYAGQMLLRESPAEARAWLRESVRANPLSLRAFAYLVASVVKARTLRRPAVA